jgi:hypothetical protein
LATKLLFSPPIVYRPDAAFLNKYSNDDLESRSHTSWWQNPLKKYVQYITKTSGKTRWRLCVWIAKTIRKMKLARWRVEDLHKYTATRAAEEFSNIIHLFRDYWDKKD